MKRHASKTQKWDKGKTKIKVGQTAKSVIQQGGNAITINASEIGVARIRPQ